MSSVGRDLHEQKGSQDRNKPLRVADGSQVGAGREVSSVGFLFPIPLQISLVRHPRSHAGPCKGERPPPSPPRANPPPEPRPRKQEQIRMEGRHLMGASQLGEQPDDRMEALPEVTRPRASHPAVYKPFQVLPVPGRWPTRSGFEPGIAMSSQESWELGSWPLEAHRVIIFRKVPT